VHVQGDPIARRDLLRAVAALGLVTLTGQATAAWSASSAHQLILDAVANADGRTLMLTFDAATERFVVAVDGDALPLLPHGLTPTTIMWHADGILVAGTTRRTAEPVWMEHGNYVDEVAASGDPDMTAEPDVGPIGGGHEHAATWHVPTVLQLRGTTWVPTGALHDADGSVVVALLRSGDVTIAVLDILADAAMPGSSHAVETRDLHTGHRLNRYQLGAGHSSSRVLGRGRDGLIMSADTPVAHEVVHISDDFRPLLHLPLGSEPIASDDADGEWTHYVQTPNGLVTVTDRGRRQSARGGARRGVGRGPSLILEGS
jgi:hypothetical protein